MYASTVMHKYCTGFLRICDWPFMVFQLTKHHFQQSHGYRSAKAAETRLSSSNVVVYLASNSKDEFDFVFMEAKLVCEHDKYIHTQ